MNASDKNHSHKSSRPVRVAIEGCGHGTLDAIYASIAKGCEVKGWDNVDIVIICGDFQAVRDRLDLNVTAMPAKYRELADFHQYYWGKRKAPYLTLFIGGNHEASNHLWELYYGGWVAPNIYYLGAANVIQFGHLKIAALSGIWKGYDYKKPHYERLPYSSDDMYSIYHVRELDVRKLLAYRSQVDVGLSHDWPRGIEWLGNHRQLFQHKRHLKEDADNGKLGNVAAKNVLDHLRPSYWFSAHLHVRYTAIKQHEEHSTTQDHGKPANVAETSSESLSDKVSKVAAWQGFHVVAKDNEAKEQAQSEQELQARREEADRTGVPITAGYAYNETYKRVKLEDGFSRTVASIATTVDEPARSESNQAHLKNIPQLDGCCTSLPTKRNRSPDTENIPNATATPSATVSLGFDGAGVTSNPDAIDLDSSEDERDSVHGVTVATKDESEEAPLLPLPEGDENDRGGWNASDSQSVPNNAAPSQSDPITASSASNGHISRHPKSTEEGGNATSDKKSINHQENGVNISAEPSDEAREAQAAGEQIRADNPHNDNQSTEEVSEEMRAQLAALSTKFAEPQKVEVSAPLPHPEAIKNTTTRFLALSKCAPDQRFLQLMEIQPPETDLHEEQTYPKLRYDPEWLAILRTFSDELTLGGDARDQVPVHRGDTYYREKIMEEEKWVADNIEKMDLLDVPNNFSITLSEEESTNQTINSEMPVEATNPQTTAFCQLIGIENKFDFGEPDRSARQAQGPRQIKESRGGGRGGHSHRGNSGGRGGFHRGRGGRGRGRRF